MERQPSPDRIRTWLGLVLQVDMKIDGEQFQALHKLWITFTSDRAPLLVENVDLRAKITKVEAFLDSCPSLWRISVYSHRRHLRLLVATA